MTATYIKVLDNNITGRTNPKIKYWSTNGYDKTTYTLHMGTVDAVIDWG